MKKGGAGKANWGTHKDEQNEEEKEERRERRERPDRRQRREEEPVEEVKEEEPEVEVIGLKEYKEAKKKREVQVKEEVKEKKEVDFKSMEKEGLSKMTIRKEIANDDQANRNFGGKKASKYSAMNTADNKEMLGLSTGFLTKSDKYPSAPRKQENRPRKNNNKKSLNVEDANNFPTL